MSGAHLDAAAVAEACAWTPLMDAIAEGLGADGASPDRHVHELPPVDGQAGALLLMPSWRTGSAIGVKVVTYLPSNAGTPVPSVNAGYLLFDATTGVVLASIEGDSLTTRRTAAISALAARSLARADTARVLVCGTGQLAPQLARAHAAERELSWLGVWGRRPEAAAPIVDALRAEGLPAEVVTDLDAAVASADLISCGTGATEPFLRGALLRPGTHVDLVGSFAEGMRESDDEVARAGRWFVDTRAGALLAGDLAAPIGAGLLADTDVVADLGALVAGTDPGRRSDAEITVFKSAGFAGADLSAALLVAAHHGVAPPGFS